MFRDHVLFYPHDYATTLDIDETQQSLTMKGKTNMSLYTRPRIYRPETEFLINPTDVKHESFGDISNDSATYLFKVRYGS